ncbi:MAG: amino acid adenylation domain-containing protein [Solirubrobacterales bacterium]|nr:amino acid adenylation domain-containing protein [Solirubrobacterales bacterium]
MSGLLQDYVTAQAERRADAVALVMGERRLTYGELERLSNQLAHLLVEAGCRPGDRVCLCTEKSPQAIVGMLAALKARCTYVPIDVASPTARIARIVRSADPAVVLTMGAAMSLVGELLASEVLAPGLPVGALERFPGEGPGFPVAFDAADWDSQPGERAPRTGDPQEIAHLLFTSGSTGDPKGVAIIHANVRAFVEWAVEYFGTEPGDRISGHPPLHFDLSTFDIYATFSAGATLFPVPPSTLLPGQLGEFISSNQLTQWFSVPSTMTYMAKFGAVPERGFPSLKRVLWCGEVLPTAILIDWMKRIAQASFTNLYGPTEATIASSFYTVEEIPRDETAPIPIGTACAGEELLVLDGECNPVPPGEIGELYIAGAGISPGYWRDERRTSEAFRPDPRPGRGEQRIYRTGDLARFDRDGLAYFLGRTDSQIKSRGYRIELGEIEAALNARPEIVECAVVGVESAGFEGTSICCAFRPASEADSNPAALRSALAALLPTYMLPSHWRSLEALPKNVNGKIDRRRLREMFSAEQSQA